MSNATPPPQSPPAIRERALRAASGLARDLGLGDVVPQVLSDRGSLMVRMPGAGLVARVSTHTGAQRRTPGWWLGQEVAVGRIAQRAGAPVVPPAADAGPHEVDGLWISLWTDLGDQDSRATPEESAAALAQWHRVLGEAGADLPVMPITHELITEPLEYAERLGHLDHRTRVALTREHEGALAGVEGLGTRQVLLHGDAHRGNLLRDIDGTWLWNDLEEACRGPIEWDLAVLGSTPDEESGRAALSAYGELTGTPVPTQEELAPWLRLRNLEGIAWLIGCAVTFPERYAEPARRAVEALVADSASGERDSRL